MHKRIIKALSARLRHLAGILEARAWRDEELEERLIKHVEIPALEAVTAELERGRPVAEIVRALAEAFGRVLGLLVAHWRRDLKSRCNSLYAEFGAGKDAAMTELREEERARAKLHPATREAVGHTKH